MKFFYKITYALSKDMITLEAKWCKISCQRNVTSFCFVMFLLKKIINNKLKNEQWKNTIFSYHIAEQLYLVLSKNIT